MDRKALQNGGDPMGRNILVVEDDKNISDLIHMYLVKEGFDVRIAGDGGKAIEEFQKQVPDLILLDIMLPALSGMEVLRRLRPDLVVERFTGEAPPRYHYGPGWGLVRNETLWTMLEKRLEELDAYQGEIFISLQEERAAGDVSAHASRNP